MSQDDELGRRIARLLDESADQVTAAQRERLRAARTAALARHRENPVPAWVPAWAAPVAGPLSRFSEDRVFGIRYALPLAALVLGLLGVAYMHVPSPANDIAEIDAGLLTDELPIDAYLDQGFDSWLRRSSQ